MAIEYPFNKEVETELLAIMLNHPRTIPYVTKKVPQSMFYLETHKNAYKSMIYCYNMSNEKMDPIMVIEQYKKMFENRNDADVIISEIMHGGISDDRIDWYITRVQEYASRRKLIKMSQYTQKHANDLTFDVLDLISKLQTGVDLIRGAQSTETNLSDDIAMLEQNIGNKNATVPFGIPILDTKAAGFMRNDITTIGGRTSHGKTTWAIDTIKRQLDLGYTVDIITNEMTKQLYLQKLACNIANIEYQRIIKFGDITEEETVKFKEATAYMREHYVGNLRVYEFISSIGQITSLIQANKPDIFWLDWLQRIPLVPGVHDAREWIKITYGEIARVVPKSNTAAVIISQLSTRKAQARANKRPELFDFDDSSFIEKASCDCHLIYWYYNDTMDKEFMTIVEMIAAKNRFGQPAMALLSHDPRTGRYNDTSLIPVEKRKAYLQETGIGYE